MTPNQRVPCFNDAQVSLKVFVFPDSSFVTFLHYFHAIFLSILYKVSPGLCSRGFLFCSKTTNSQRQLYRDSHPDTQERLILTTTSCTWPVLQDISGGIRDTLRHFVQLLVISHLHFPSTNTKIIPNLSRSLPTLLPWSWLNSIQEPGICMQPCYTIFARALRTWDSILGFESDVSIIRSPSILGYPVKLKPSALLLEC